MKQEIDKAKIVRLLLQVILWIVSIVLGFIWYDWKLVLILFLFTWANTTMLWESKILPLEKMIKLIFKSISFENGEGKETKT